MVFQSLLLPNELQSSIRWLMGSIDYISLPEIGLLSAGFILELLFLIRFRKELDIFRTGEESALSVGVDTSRLQFLGFLTVSISAGIAVSITGMIGFIGLVSPHLARLLYRKHNPFGIIPLFLVSSVLITASGVISRSLFPGTIFPIGVVTSLIGAPFLLFLLKSFRN